MTAPATVAHVVLSLETGGLERLVCNLLGARELADLRTFVYCLDERGTLAPDAERMGARVCVVKRRPGFDPRLIVRLAAAFRRDGISVVHTHSLDPMFYGGIAAWLAGVPLRVHTQHDTQVSSYSFKDRAKLFIAGHLAGAVVAVSAQTQRDLAPYCIPRSRRYTIINGIDCERFSGTPAGREPRPAGEGAGGPRPWVIGAVSRLSAEKGLHRLVEAFAGVRRVHPAARLEIAGEGPLRDQLTAQAARLGIGGAVRLRGHQARVEDFLQALDLFVLPSLTEGIPLALLEAMAAGLPIVATAVGGVPEVVEDGESAILVPPDDAGALERAVLGLLERPQERVRLGRNAVQRVRSRHSLAAMARAYRWLYLADPPERWWKRAGKALTRALPRRWLAWRVRGARPEIALTFDDGPEPEFTPQILDVLRAQGVQATFFLVGEKVAVHPELVARIVREGHEVANHSYSHPDFGRLSWGAAVDEIRRTQAAIQAIQGRPVRLFRPPEGKLSRMSVFGAWRCRQTIVMWSVDLKDYRAADPAEIADRLGPGAFGAGDIVLYHGNSPAAIAALPQVVAAAVRGGRRGVPVSRLLA